jgi:hypothetical protein
MIVDRSIDQLMELEQQVKKATTFTEALPLLVRKKEVEDQIALRMAELNRLSHGWVFALPNATIEKVVA